MLTYVHMCMCRMACKCLWDTNTDDFAQQVFTNVRLRRGITRETPPVKQYSLGTPKSNKLASFLFSLCILAIHWLKMGLEITRSAYLIVCCCICRRVCSAWQQLLECMSTKRFWPSWGHHKLYRIYRSLPFWF